MERIVTNFEGHITDLRIVTDGPMHTVMDGTGTKVTVPLTRAELDEWMRRAGMHLEHDLSDAGKLFGGLL